jgi:hypothetical protein
MSERDSVHKEIEKLQDEVQETKRKMSLADSRTKLHDEEVRGKKKLKPGFMILVGSLLTHC